MWCRKEFRSRLIAGLSFSLVVWLAAAKHVPAASGPPDLSGAWQVNGGASEFPDEVTFGPQWEDLGQPASGGRGGSGGRRGGRGGGGGLSVFRTERRFPGD